MRDSSHASQVFEQVPEGQQQIDPVGRPVCHRSALKQATGEAVYCDDIPKYESKKHHNNYLLNPLYFEANF